MRWVRSGTNWEGRAWTVPPSMLPLLNELEDAYPGSHPEDGTVASKTHDELNPSSDHRPKPYTGPGTVRAVDIGVNGSQGEKIAEALRASKDERIKYVIYDGRIFTSFAWNGRKAWEWGPYTGPNPHKTHIHVSLLLTKDNVTRPWNLNLGGDMFLPLKEGDESPDVGLLQRMLNDTYDLELKVDDKYGPATTKAVLDNLITGSGDGRTVSDFHWHKLMTEWTDWRISKAPAQNVELVTEKVSVIKSIKIK